MTAPKQEPSNSTSDGEQYIFVKTLVTKAQADVKPPSSSSDKKDEKAQVSTRMTLSRTMGRGKGKMKPMSVVLNYRLSLASSANTAYNTVLSVTPSNSSEFAGFAALYDEMIVDGGHYEFIAHTTAVISAGNLWGALAFDPINFGVYTNVSAVCEAQYHKLFPIVVNLGPSVVQPIGPLQHKFAWKSPKGKSARTSGSSNTAAFAGEWSACQDASDNYGFIKPYLEAGATGVITNLSGFVFLNCRFRSRT